MVDPATAATAFKFAAKEVAKGMIFRGEKSPEEKAQLRVDRLTAQTTIDRDRPRGGNVQIPRNIPKYEPQYRGDDRPPVYTEAAQTWLAAALAQAKVDLAKFRPVAPPPVAPPPVAPPIVTAPPVVIEPPPRVVTGEVLTPSQRIAYDEALRQLKTAELLGKYGGRGSVGGALRLGAALWQEFGQEILIENAQKEAQAKAKAAAEEARKGPLGRRQKTAKRGKIKRPPQPPQPPQPPNARRSSPVADAQRQAKAQMMANKITPKPADSAAKTESKGPKARRGPGSRANTGQKSKNQRPLTRSQMLGIGSSLLVNAVSASQLLKNAGASLAFSSSAPDLQTQLQPATSSGGAGLTGTQTGTAEGNKDRECRIVCRRKGQRRKKKKRNRKVCIDKGTLTKFVKSTIKGK